LVSSDLRKHPDGILLKELINSLAKPINYIAGLAAIVSATRGKLMRAGGSEAMCYNCGCNMPDNPMGMGHAGAEPEGKSITNKTFEEAGKSMEQSTDEARRNALDLLKKVRGEKPVKIMKDPSGYDRYDDA
jgi:hypothetical protein